MNSDVLERHFDQTPAPSPAARQRMAWTLNEAIRASTDPTRAPGRYRPSRRYVRQWSMIVPSMAVLVTAVATVVVVHRPGSNPSIVRVSDVYSLAAPGVPTDPSTFDSKTRRLLKSERVAHAWNIGTAAGRSFYRFSAGHGRSCYGQAATSGKSVAVSQLFCFTGAGLPSPVVDMSTVALDPAKAPANLRLIAVSGIAASEVETIRLTTTAGAVTDVPVVGDVYALPNGQVPRRVASITALSRSGRVIWTETF